MSTCVHIQQLVALILGVFHAELVFYILRCWMHLQAEIAPFHGVQKVKTDWKFGTEAVVYHFAEQVDSLLEHEIDRRYFESSTSKFLQQAIFFRNAIETPGVVNGRPV